MNARGHYIRVTIKRSIRRSIREHSVRQFLALAIMRHLLLINVLVCLAALSGCRCGCLEKRGTELAFPTDVRKSQFWCFGEDALFHYPSSPKGEFYGHRPTCWREWPADGAEWRDLHCGPPIESAMFAEPTMMDAVPGGGYRPGSGSDQDNPFRDDTSKRVHDGRAVAVRPVKRPAASQPVLIETGRGRSQSPALNSIQVWPPYSSDSTGGFYHQTSTARPPSERPSVAPPATIDAHPSRRNIPNLRPQPLRTRPREDFISDRDAWSVNPRRDVSDRDSLPQPLAVPRPPVRAYAPILRHDVPAYTSQPIDLSRGKPSAVDTLDRLTSSQQFASQTELQEQSLQSEAATDLGPLLGQAQTSGATAASAAAGRSAVIPVQYVEPTEESRDAETLAALKRFMSNQVDSPAER